jgi:hypothetical protein
MGVGHCEVPMFRVFRTFDGPEILMLAGASILIAAITYLL